jgi:Na+/melibiose symporter-like transporter
MRVSVRNVFCYVSCAFLIYYLLLRCIIRSMVTKRKHKQTSDRPTTTTSYDGAMRVSVCVMFFVLVFLCLSNLLSSAFIYYQIDGEQKMAQNRQKGTTMASHIGKFINGDYLLCAYLWFLS